MYDLTKLSKFNLARGSHQQPNDNGDVCLMEAAIIAARFKHRAVTNAYDCPECFSRVIAQYAIGLNDRIPDELRNPLLIPLIPYLAGTADADAVERRRILYIVYAITRFHWFKIVIDPNISMKDHINAMSQTVDGFFDGFEHTRQWHNATIILQHAIQIGMHIPFTPPPRRPLRWTVPAHHYPQLASQ